MHLRLKLPLLERSPLELRLLIKKRQRGLGLVPVLARQLAALLLGERADPSQQVSVLQHYVPVDEVIFLIKVRVLLRLVVRLL
ncbi:hypothetical protein BDR03DRAFT_965797 [Suillus americanus]|nr:hypothetical protein BDR03DRAFT_965797 [Suillus americanus]